MKILHVDDESDIREVTALSLSIDPDFDVTSCASGQEALDLLETGWRPELVLLDGMMPGLDGPATLEQLRLRPGCETVPVIFMTARAQASEQKRYLSLGAIAVITKPFDPMSLAGEVRDILAARAP